MTEVEPQKNGFHSDEDEDSKNQRPVNIEADVHEMERRKRVETIMNSKIFREELERVVGDRIHNDQCGEEGISAIIKVIYKTHEDCFLSNLLSRQLSGVHH